MKPTQYVRPIFITAETVACILGVSVSTVEKLTREHERTKFPQPRLISGRRTGYPYDEIEEWAADRPISDLPPPPNTGHRKSVHCHTHE